MSALMLAVESIKTIASPECPATVAAPGDINGGGGGGDGDGGSLSGARAPAALAEADGEEGESCLPVSYTISITLVTAGILGGVVLVKSLLFVYCRHVQRLRGSATVEAYADDHKNDVRSHETLKHGLQCASLRASQCVQSAAATHFVFWIILPAAGPCERGLGGGILPLAVLLPGRPRRQPGRWRRLGLLGGRALVREALSKTAALRCDFPADPTAFLIAFVLGRWPDPVAALILSLYIFTNWVESGREQLLLLVGHVAPPRLLAQLTYAAATHEPDHVLVVDKILAWSVGEFHSAEVDICLPPDMPLRVAHDIGERLEVLIEMLPEIERCHVHLDWETEHKAEHQGTKGGLFSLKNADPSLTRTPSPVMRTPSPRVESPTQQP
jgi:divalent metal cation (Fe/Co/Zn/Cd) transporter